MALVLAVKARQGKGCVDDPGLRHIRRGVRTQWGEVSARRSAGLIGAVWTVAVVIVDASKGDGDGGVGDAREAARVLVELGDFE